MYICLILLALQLNAKSQIEYSFSTKEAVYVVGDVHGAYEEIVSTLKTTSLINTNLDWTGGESHFVSLGDLMDRGPSTRKILDLYMKLQIQASQVGGKFHVVLGNHEIMNLTGDLRYVSNKEIQEFQTDESDEQRTQAYELYLSKNKLESNQQNRENFDNKYLPGYFAQKEAYSMAGKYGKWLLNLPFVIRINDQLFAHGGLSKQVKNVSLNEFNKMQKTNLHNYLTSWSKLMDNKNIPFEPTFHERAEAVKGLKNSLARKTFLKSKKQLLFSSVGATWYRGNAICHPYFETDNLSLVLKNWKAKRLWVGHTTSNKRVPLTRLNDKLRIIDTGMLRSHYKGLPWIAKLTADKNISYINGLTGELGKVHKSPNREWANPFNMSDKQTEDFLLTAKVMSKVETKEGITKPFKVTLEKEGRTINALFKYKDSYKKAQSGSWNKSKEAADRYQYELVAYKLDRMLSIGLVPVTVIREIDGKTGALQLWIEDLISDLQMNRDKIYYRGHCDANDQVNLMDTFDYLIGNTDRNQSNIVYNKSDWQIWFIDHSKSFGTSTKRPKILKKSIIRATDSFKEALRPITFDDLQKLKPWLHGKQIQAIWKRAKKIKRGKF